MLWEQIASLELEVEDLGLDALSVDTANGWTRHTTIVRLRGRGLFGAGEDVCYEPDDQLAFQAAAHRFDLRGRMTLAEFSRRLDAHALFDPPPSRTVNELYRRWAFESAALDLALRQNDTNLAAALSREPRPLRYVVSLGLGEGASLAPLERVRARFPDIGFKVDYAEDWTADTVAALAAFGGIAAVDLKGLYRGWFSGPPPSVEMYRAIANGLPDAWIEDPVDEGAAWDGLAPFAERVTWDVPIHSVADLVQRPIQPRCVNIKPSRFGFVAELLRTYEYCEARGISMYGGGQFELGPGRAHIQYLASLFHADTPNDVAPAGFNRPELDDALPGSPLELALASTGFALSES